MRMESRRELKLKLACRNVDVHKATGGLVSCHKAEVSLTLESKRRRPCFTGAEGSPPKIMVPCMFSANLSLKTPYQAQIQ